MATKRLSVLPDHGLESSPAYSAGDSAETHQDVTETSMSDGESSVDSEPSLAELEVVVSIMQ